MRGQLTGSFGSFRPAIYSMPCGNTSGGTTWLQTKVFFQALGRNFVDEFKPGGCVSAFAEGVDKADFLGAIPPGQPIIEDAIKGTAATVAAN